MINSDMETILAPELQIIKAGKITEEAMLEYKSRVGRRLRVNTFNDAASKNAIRKFADGIGDENPLWRSESYSAETPYKKLIAPPSWLISVFPSWILQGLKGVHAIHASTEWEFHKPVYMDDVIKPVSYFTGFDIKETKFAGRTVLESQTAEYFNQNDELVATARPKGFRTDRDNVRENKIYADLQLPHLWTEDELEEIENEILSEKRRGSDPLFWENVEPGDTLPHITKGPLGLTDMIAFCIGADPVGIRAHGSSLKSYRKHPAWCFRDPYTSALEPIYSVHYSKTTAQACGLPYPYDLGIQRHCWIMQLITNWIGDYGWLKYSYSEYRKFVYFSDAVRLTGKVTKKYIDDDGEYCVDIETNAVNQRGEEVIPGKATVVLPSNRDKNNALSKRLR